MKAGDGTGVSYRVEIAAWAAAYAGISLCGYKLMYVSLCGYEPISTVTDTGRRRHL